MPDADQLRWYFSGAASDGGAQTDPDLSLGNFRSSTEAERQSWMWRRTLRNVSLNLVSGANGQGIGSLEVVSADSLRYTAPGSSTPGSPVTLSNGQTAAIPDGTPSKYVRVTRTSTSAMAGSGAVEMLPTFLNVFGMGNETVGTQKRYRAVFVRNTGSASVTSLRFALHPLTTAVTTAVNGLPGAGAGTIAAAGENFAGWPKQGWARIADSGGTLREIVYYTSRTRMALSVPAGGRGRLGTSAAAGAATDTVVAIPGIRIGWEAASPAANGSVQTIASETTAPTGITWSTAIATASGPSAGTLATNEQGVVWIERDPAGATAMAKEQIAIDAAWTLSGVNYTETAWGNWRNGDSSLARYELHIGTNAEPDLTLAANETFTSLPYVTTTTFVPSNTYYLVVNRRNAYNLVSQNVLTTRIQIAAGPVQATLPPSAPELVSVAASASGNVKIKGTYNYASDPAAQQANQWLVYTKTGGTDPVPGVDSPAVVAMTKVAGVAWLDYTAGPYSNGTVVRSLLRVRRTSDTVDSASSSVAGATASTTGPTGGRTGAFLGHLAEVGQ